MKRLLLIMNPAAGMKKANPHLTEILSILGAAGYECLTFMTQKRGDGTTLAAKYAASVDRIVCIGGDGTFNEVISGVVACGAQTPIGYIPAGSTNDFAASLNLSKNVLQAALDVVAGKPSSFDVGRFQNRYFTYVASFGAFTRTSYSTSQSVKNALGHLAYVLGGIRELSSLRRYRVRALLDDGTDLKDDYIFGLELLLVRYPRNMSALAEVIHALTTQDYHSRMLAFHPAKKLTVWADPQMDWTLDGEYAKGATELQIENLHSAVQIVVNN